MRDYRYQKEIDERLPLPKGGGWEITATLKTYISLLFVHIVTNKNYPIHMFGKIKISADKL